MLQKDYLQLFVVYLCSILLTILLAQLELCKLSDLSIKIKFRRASNKQGYSTFRRFRRSDWAGCRKSPERCQTNLSKIKNWNYRRFMKWTHKLQRLWRGLRRWSEFTENLDKQSFWELNLKDLVQKVTSLLALKVNDKVNRKSSLCWLLTKNNSKLNAYRLLHVRGCEEEHKKNPTLFLEKEKYYAIYYTEGWYIDRIIGTSTESKLTQLNS